MSKHIITGQSTNINVFSWLLFFFKLREREREREWYTKFGYKGEIAQNYLSYFSTGFHWRIFLLSRVNRLYAIFNTGLKNLGSLVSQIFFCLQHGILAMVRLPATNPAQKLSYYLLPLRGRSPHFRFGVPANHLASLFSPLVSGDLRLLSTNTCWYPLCDLHSSLTVTFFDGSPLFIPTGG